MKILALSLAKFTLILILVCYVVSNLIYSADVENYWEYETQLLHQKYLDFQTQSDCTNVVFIESSKFYRQINPLVFDSVVSNGMSSYNLSVPNFFPVRSYNFVRKFSEEHKAVKTIFIEISPIARIGKNYDTNPNINAIDNQTFADVTSFCLSSNYPLVYKLGYFAEYSLLYLYKYLGFGAVKFIRSILFQPENKIPQLSESISRNRGYYSFENQLSEKKSGALLDRRNQFINNSKSILGQAIKDNSERNTSFPPSTDNISMRLKKLAVNLQKQGVSIIFIIPPRQKKHHLNFLRAQKSLLRDFPIIDLSSSSRYEFFYTEEGSFDRSHLNNTGSSLMSVEVANAYLNLANSPS
jgi:hypothetical protein